MIRLTYTSTATETITPSMIISMLESARRNNAPQGVTGLLYCAQGQFAQCLEGEEAAVNAIYENIRADPRHHDLRATRAPIEARQFTDWSMAFVDTSRAEVAKVLLSHDINSYEPQKWPHERIPALMATLGQSLRAEKIPVSY